MKHALFASLVLFASACTTTAQVAARETPSLPPGLMSDTYVFLHENPELGKDETMAHEYLAEALGRMPGVALVGSERAPTAVIGVFDTGRPGPTIALRSEMDARKLTPGTTEPASHMPRSTVDGLMHNCGHDVHAAILLGAAQEITAHPEKYKGKIVFLFQPAEEVKGGADDIVAEGLLEKLGVEAIFALHSAPTVPVGRVEISSGAALAGSNYFDVFLTGKGSHAAAPYEGADLPLTATKFVEALSNLPARRVDISNRPFVVSVTRLIADSGTMNVIPTEARISGTVRAFEDLDVGFEGGPGIRQLMTETVKGLADAYGVTANFSLRAGSPPTINNTALLTELEPKLRANWAGSFVVSDRKEMFSEDFSYYTAELPSLYFGLGVAKDGLGDGGVHTPDFTVHPDALMVGRDWMLTIASAMLGVD